MMMMVLLGALRNAQRVSVVFGSSWKLRMYYRAGDVLSQLLARLHELGAELVDVTSHSDGKLSSLAPMLWRMSVLDDPSVDVVLCRDADR